MLLTWSYLLLFLLNFIDSLYILHYTFPITPISPFPHLHPLPFQPPSKKQSKILKYNQNLKNKQTNLREEAVVWPSESHSLLLSPYIFSNYFIVMNHWSDLRPLASATLLTLGPHLDLLDRPVSWRSYSLDLQVCPLLLLFVKCIWFPCSLRLLFSFYIVYLGGISIKLLSQLL